MTNNNMTIDEMIERYDLFVTDDGRVGTYKVAIAKRDNAMAMVSANKPAIVAEIKRRKDAKQAAEAAAEAKAQQIADNIDGLRELNETISGWSKFNVAMARMCYGGCSTTPIAPKHTVDEIKAMYPAAAAYTKVESWMSSADKLAYAKQAMDAINNGADPIEAAAKMDADYTDYCLAHID